MALDKYKIFKNLEGHWHFIREIDNKLIKSLSGCAIGVANFVSVKNSSNLLHYVEHGEFITIAGHKSAVTQEYFYNFTDTGDIEVHFASCGVIKEFFHAVGDGEAIKHVCLNDTYKVDYKFFDDHFTINYNVIGPKKNYSSHTTFKRFL